MVEEIKPQLPQEDQNVIPPPVSTDVTTVKDMVERIHSKLDEFADDIDEEFVKEMEAQLKAKRNGNGNGQFICKNKYWDLWFQKLFAQFISVKLWIILLITILLQAALITNIQFASILGIIMGLKGTFQVADVWKKNGHGNGNGNGDHPDYSRSAMDKT